jgi:hypothetical protein
MNLNELCARIEHKTARLAVMVAHHEYRALDLEKLKYYCVGK